MGTSTKKAAHDSRERLCDQHQWWDYFTNLYAPAETPSDIIRM
ncbi:MAG TPA: hypothetical protein VMZ69_11205 [Saprospiraceae bacterium]|nr:hypothetical protein [Saprospiraceae bacterium]